MAQIKNYETKVCDLYVVRETEKAYGFKAFVSNNYSASSKCWEVTVWVPKSVVKDGIISDWFVQKKYAEYNEDGKDMQFAK